MATTEEFDILSEYVNHNIVKKGNEIYSGNVKVSPYVEGDSSSCDYCPYKAVCGFDVKIKGYEDRNGTVIDKKEIFEYMKTENALSRGKKKE